MRSVIGTQAAVERTTRARYAGDVSSAQAILAAIKPDDASNAALAMAHWLAEQERRGIGTDDDLGPDGAHDGHQLGPERDVVDHLAIGAPEEAVAGQAQRCGGRSHFTGPALRQCPGRDSRVDELEHCAKRPARVGWLGHLRGGLR